MTKYYLSRQHPGQKYTLSTHRTTGAENIGPYPDHATALKKMLELNTTIRPRPRPAKQAPPATPPKALLTRQEFGEQIYQAIKAEIESRGFSLWVENFDPEYPIGLRQIGYIRKGRFKIETLRRLPGVKVVEWFTLD